MASSSTEALSQFKVRNAGFLGQTAQNAMAAVTPSAGAMGFMTSIRNSGQRGHQTVIDGLAARQAALTVPGGAAGGNYPTTGYRAPDGSADRESKAGAYGYEAFKGRYGLTTPASKAFTRLEQAYKKQFGTNFSVTHGWRSVEEEAALADKYAGTGVTTSKPGEGVHGHGTAVDLGGALTDAGSKQHAWMRENAAFYGWYWVGKTWNEPWHWEYFPSKDQSKG